MFSNSGVRSRAPRRLVLDLDATDDPIHGEQEGRFFHGYDGHDCYLPLYIFCGDFPLVARLRPSDIVASEGALQETVRSISLLTGQAARLFRELR